MESPYLALQVKEEDRRGHGTDCGCVVWIEKETGAPMASVGSVLESHYESSQSSLIERNG